MDYGDLFNQAEQLRMEGKIPQALDAYTGLLRQYLDRQAGESVIRFTINEFYILDRFADLTLLVGKKAAAEHALLALTNLAKAAGNNGIRIHAVNKLFFVHLDQGKMDDAIKDVQSFSDVIGDVTKIKLSPAGLMAWEAGIQFDAAANRQDKKDQLVCLYDMLSALLVAMGRYADGILMLLQGIALAEKNPSPIVDARLWPMRLLLAKAHFENGAPEAATNLLKKAAATAPDMPIATGIPLYYLELKSRIALAQGRLGEAYENLLEIIRLCRQYRLPLAAIKATFNLARLKVQLNQVADATDLLHECLDDAEKAGEIALAARINQYLAVAEKKAGAKLPILTYPGRRAPFSPGSAAPHNLQTAGYTKSPRPTDFFAAFEEKALLLQLYLSGDQPEKAAEIFSQLRLTSSGCDSGYIQRHLGMLELLFFSATQQPVRAGYPFKDILECFSSAQLLPVLWQFRQLVVHTPLIPEEEKPGWMMENQRLLDQITNSLPPMMQTLYLLNKWSPNEEYLAALSNDLMQRKHSIHDVKSIFRRWRLKWNLMAAIHNFQENANRYRDYLAREIVKGSRPGMFNFSPDRKDLLGKLCRQPFRQLTMAYLVLPDRIVIVSRSLLRLKVHVTYMNRIALRQLVFDVRDRLFPGGATRGIDLSGWPKVDPSITIGQLSQQLDQILQLDSILKAHGRRIRRLTLVPDDVLHGFPFTLLTLGDMPTKIATPTKTATSMTIAISIDDHVARQPALRFRGSEALLAGVAKGIPNQKDLPRVPDEIDQIDKLLNRYGIVVHKIENQEAGPDVVKQWLKMVDLAHFACHGKFDFRQPDQSGLLLAHGEMLTLKDLLALGDLSKIKLAVLSSCRGAEHFILPGRWVIGLPETLCRAGVQTVLAFLWPVDDAFAMVFCTRFYEYLRKNAPARALQLTQADAINRCFTGIKADYWLPQSWAGAILYQR